MPWPYITSRSKAPRSGTSSDPDDIQSNAAAIGALSLEEAGDSGNIRDEGRRAASLDISRPSASSVNAFTPLNATSTDTSKQVKARRSSFPRLALPSWRQPPSTPASPSSSSGILPLSRSTASSIIGSSSPRRTKSRHSSRRQSLALDDLNDDELLEEEGVELQEGYGTPYTATGLKGGFQCTSPPPPSTTLSGSSSIASTSSSSRRSGSSHFFSLLSSGTSATSRTSDEYSLDLQSSPSHTSNTGEEEAHENAGVKRESSIINKPSSNVVPVLDSGFSEFGPHSIIEAEEERRRTSFDERERSRDINLSEDEDDDGRLSSSRDGGSNVTIPKKVRSRGWFSFNSSSTPAASASKGENGVEDTVDTPRNERDMSHVSSSSGSVTDLATASTTAQSRGEAISKHMLIPPSTSAVSPNTSMTGTKKIKQSASAKGINMIRSAGRKRGDSEVSMKEMTSFS